MSKFDMIVELMVKNGVTTKFSENLFKNLVNDEPIIELDFSEHDKVFEDKIAGLKAKIAIKDMNYKTASELLGKYQQENESLKQRIAELESENENLKQGIDKMATSESKWIDRAVEWQQKCEKLESKEVEKSTKYTTVIVAKEINGQEYVRLEDFMSVVNDFQAEIGT